MAVAGVGAGRRVEPNPLARPFARRLTNTAHSSRHAHQVRRLVARREAYVLQDNEQERGLPHIASSSTTESRGLLPMIVARRATPNPRCNCNCSRRALN